MTVSFDPDAAVSFAGNLAITSNDPDESPQDVGLSGMGFVPVADMSVVPASLPFGDVAISAGMVELSVTVSNAATATADLEVSATTVTNTTGFGFALVPLTVPFTLTPGSSQDVTVSFDPDAVDPFVGDLEIVSNDGTTNVALSGNGVVAPAGINLELPIITGGSSTSDTVSTAEPVPVTPGRVYVATVVSKSYKPITSLVGLGGTWSLEATQCGGRNQTGVSVFVSTDASSTGVVTATFSASTSNAIITVAGYSGVSLTDPTGAVNSANSNGITGACTGGSDSASYSLPLTTTASASARGRSHRHQKQDQHPRLRLDPIHRGRAGIGRRHRRHGCLRPGNRVTHHRPRRRIDQRQCRLGRRGHRTQSRLNQRPDD